MNYTYTREAMEVTWGHCDPCPDANIIVDIEYEDGRVEITHFEATIIDPDTGQVLDTIVSTDPKDFTALGLDWLYSDMAKEAEEHLRAYDEYLVDTRGDELYDEWKAEQCD